jgi:hypothetical protein
MTWLTDHASDQTFLRPLLFEFNLPTVQRWVAWDHPVSARGHVWTPKEIKLTAANGNPDDPGIGATIEIGNADGTGLTAFALAKQGSRVTVWAAYLDAAGGSIDSQAEVLVCSGLLGTWNGDQDKVSISVDPMAPWGGIAIPRRYYTVIDFPRLDPR